MHIRILKDHVILKIAAENAALQSQEILNYILKYIKTVILEL